MPTQPPPDTVDIASTWLSRLAEPEVSCSSAWSWPIPAPIARDPPPLRQMPTPPELIGPPVAPPPGNAAAAAWLVRYTGVTKLPDACSDMRILHRTAVQKSAGFANDTLAAAVRKMWRGRARVNPRAWNPHQSGRDSWPALVGHDLGTELSSEERC